ncbi:unnamed protein product [Dovyalis caffra]|uniref:Uncharacterized protein n=1 Tax=Dovyalis caffra TaxID=77055 RepID=A0AAV1S0C1_9ROSI|nr:unnamed protein product [Dovyalis caffra]
MTDLVKEAMVAWKEIPRETKSTPVDTSKTNCTISRSEETPRVNTRSRRKLEKRGRCPWLEHMVQKSTWRTGSGNPEEVDVSTEWRTADYGIFVYGMASGVVLLGQVL